jgi:alkanesulfonate monooxygenase SsuD/methylene tetrahydromethanopterin reductase-like flavin-dependent oxidoreductase (luciferase family)
MKFQVSLPGLTLFQGLGGQPGWARDVSTDELARMARSADQLGFDYLSVPWHLVMHQGAEAENFGPRWPHSMTAAGFLLGATQRMSVMPLVVVPCVQPIETAKALATMDWISGGRVRPVLLTGYLQSEFELLGVPYAERGAIMDEYVEAMIELWSSDDPVYDGTYVKFAGVVFEPKPSRLVDELWFGGRAKPALRRLARHGAGWMSYATPHSQMRATIDYIRSQPEFQDSPRPLSVSAYFVEATHDPVTHEEVGQHRLIVGRDSVLEQLHYLASIGVDTTYPSLESWAGPDGRAKPISSVDDWIMRLEWFAEEILPAVRDIPNLTWG